MARSSPLDRFDSKVAAAFVDGSATQTGLPKFLGLRIVDASPGRMRAELDVREELFNPFGSLHGGVMAALCDHLLACVCYPHMQRGHWAATTEFKLNYLVPVSKGTLFAEALIVSMTRTTAVVRVEVSNEGRCACMAQGTVLIREPRAASSG